MDVFLKSRGLRFAVRGSKKPTNHYRYNSKLIAVFSVLVALSCISAPANANTLVESYVKFNQKLASAIMRPYRTTMGYELETVLVEYRQQPVSFQYQLWNLRPNSVCLPLKNRSLLTYSECTVAASQLFRETCQTLQRNPNDALLYPLYKKLYCNAAASYQPVVAKVRRSAPLNETAAQRQQCSMLILKASRTRDPSDIWERDQVCGKGS